MTLHEAMIQVLRDTPSKSASASFIAEAIAAQDLFHRHDGGYPPANQIRSRARRYPHLFEMGTGGEIRLI